MRSYSTFTDVELAGLLAVEGEAVFRYLYDKYWNKIYVIARHRLNDATEAEEVVQDIFTNLWRRRSTLNLNHNFDSYFAVAAKFEVLNRLSRSARATAFEKEMAASLNTVDESTIQQLDYAELQRLFHLTVNALPEKCRIIFHLQHEKGYTHQQIAEELGISTKTVDAQLVKARKTLRGALGNLLGLVL
ncbi:MAG: RNA polymerase sigma-70 factor [Bacteroidetes bacterium]|nr:RNA polymerase sigma-70 factor [Bacteroidota bacterium]